MTEPKVNAADRRASKRISVSLPLLVRGVDAHGAAFEDTTASYDVSREGLSFSTTRELKVGQVLDIVIPKRPAGRQTTDFETKGQVVRVLPKGEGQWEIGLYFIGPRLRTYVPESA
ncbi:MAG: PilZ domain-containing protein [Acidobacteria bacterium]|nr:PilZ domain-containing protein [Acidobacteriota bacterium]